MSVCVREIVGNIMTEWGTRKGASKWAATLWVAFSNQYTPPYGQPSPRRAPRQAGARLDFQSSFWGVWVTLQAATHGGASPPYFKA